MHDPPATADPTPAGQRSRADVSVVIPAYNAAAFLADALDSVLAQTVWPAAVFVVDDGSTDGTAAVAAARAAGSPVPIHTISTANGGISAARNRAIEAAGTSLIALLDADDAWEPGFLATATAALGRAPGAVLFFAGRRLWTGTGVRDDQFLQRSRLMAMPHRDLGGGLRLAGRGIVTALAGGNFIPPSASVFRTDAARSVGAFDPALRRVEDRDFYCRLSLAGEFVFTLEPLFRYRVHAGSASSKRNQLAMARGALDVTVKLLREPWGSRFTEAERAELHRVRTRQVHVLLRAASTAGVGTYLAQRGYCRAEVGVAPILPRDVLRAVAASLGLAGSGAPR